MIYVYVCLPFQAAAIFNSAIGSFLVSCSLHPSTSDLKVLPLHMHCTGYNSDSSIATAPGKPTCRVHSVMTISSGGE